MSERKTHTIELDHDEIMGVLHNYVLDEYKVSLDQPNVVTKVDGDPDKIIGVSYEIPIA